MLSEWKFSSQSYEKPFKQRIFQFKLIIYNFHLTFFFYTQNIRNIRSRSFECFCKKSTKKKVFVLSVKMKFWNVFVVFMPIIKGRALRLKLLAGGSKSFRKNWKCRALRKSRRELYWIFMSSAFRGYSGGSFKWLKLKKFIGRNLGFKFVERGRKKKFPSLSPSQNWFFDKLRPTPKPKRAPASNPWPALLKR